ncbi:hypothetical protein K466DRAFT_583378 [Polyporus arcularius HHB13444]|uniref:Integral membrane protein n=1 Tax=Polyporus arcularius HHB13444 TaxID=1314778 RepID=A0A5C3PR55_9APHY|nr:hypothetical protein K466DRAFT_583378 [Polyporus arcularius HHB13444]
MSGTPSWPSLYNPGIELFPIEHKDPVQPRGRYLHNSHDIFRFTLYWTLVLYTPAFIACGTYAFLNLTFPPRRPSRKGYKTRPRLSSAGISSGSVSDGERIPLRRYDRQGLRVDVLNPSQLRLPSRSPAKQNEKRSRLTFAVLVFFLFACFAFGGAIVGSAITGYVAAGLFRAAKYNMSTWIPLFAAILQTLVGFLALWPTVIDII